MNKVLRLGLQGLLCFAIIAFAAWLPYAMFGGDGGGFQGELRVPAAGDEQSPETLPEKAEYMQRYLSKTEVFVEKSVEDIDKQEGEKVKQIVADFLGEMKVPEFLLRELDGAGLEPTVRTFAITTKKGASLEVYNLYFEGTLGWSNWFNVYIDRHTEKVLFFYASGSCQDQTLIHEGDYAIYPSLDEFDSSFAAYSGYEISDTSIITNDHENALHVKYYQGEQTIDYKINCVYYPGRMYDFKLEPLPRS